MQIKTEILDQMTEMLDGIESLLKLRVPPKVVNEVLVLTERHVSPLTRLTNRIQLVRKTSFLSHSEKSLPRKIISKVYTSGSCSSALFIKSFA